MSSFYTTFVAVAEDDYRRERAARDLRAVGGAHHHRRFATWRDRRRTARAVGATRSARAARTVTH